MHKECGYPHKKIPTNISFHYRDIALNPKEKYEKSRFFHIFIIQKLIKNGK